MVFAITIPYMETLMGLPGGQPTAFIVLLVALAVGVDAALTIILKTLGFLVGKTKTTLDDRLLKAVGGYLPAIASVTSLWISLEAVYPAAVRIGALEEFDLYVIFLLAILGFMLGSVADAFLIWYGLEIRPRKKAVNEREVFPFVRNVIKITILVIFFVFILQRVGFDTTALITGLGVGGIAVALALQGTLSNFFGGVHILVDKPFREDDYIRLDNGIEGTVTQIGWRTTRLLTPTNNEVVVPNAKLADSIMENYSTPHDLSGVSYSIGVDYREDIDAVEKIIDGALRKVASGNQNLDDKSIWVRFDSFGDYSLNFKFGYMVRGYVNRWDVMKAVNRELFYAFKKNDVNIPFPVRVMYPPPGDKTRKK